MFSSRIRAVAEARGVAVQMLRDPAQLGSAAGKRLIVDLNQPSAPEAAAAWMRAGGGEVIGFVGHTDAATIAAARDAGITQVLVRSRFVEMLPDLLT